MCAAEGWESTGVDLGEEFTGNEEFTTDEHGGAQKTTEVFYSPLRGVRSGR
jgi:hypothetical protein